MTETLQAWRNPTVIVALLGILGTAYAGFMVQRTRIEALEHRVTVVEQDFQRREVMAVELKAIHQRLESIQRLVESRTPP